MPYYGMAYVEGETLRQRLKKEKRLPLDAALDIVRDVGGALQFAHERGVIYRDVKPENILLGHGHAMVAGFGIAQS